MNSHLRKGSRVKWKWGSHWAFGKIVERYTEKVTRTIKGKKISRNASREEPAFLIEQNNGDHVLKQISEVERDN